MTNNNNHHSTRVFSRQSDTSIEDNLSSSSHVLASQRTHNGKVARLPRRHMLDVERDFDTSHAPARQSAQPKAEWRIDHPTHKSSSLPSHIQSGTNVSKRPDTGTNNQTSGEPQSRGCTAIREETQPLTRPQNDPWGV